MNRLQSLLQLFYPTPCAACDSNLTTGETFLCTNCRHDLSFFENNNFKNNHLQKVFLGKVPFTYAGAFFMFQKHGKVKKLIHKLKYKGQQEIGTHIGKWWGNQLKETQIFNGIDYIIPVPLHKKKQRKRGYNQLTTFGKAVGNELRVPLVEDILIRKSATKTQTYKNRFERFLNTSTIFELTNLDVFKNKHVLLIDDVITTGATIESCSKELLKTDHIKISILAIAFTS